MDFKVEDYYYTNAFFENKNRSVPHNEFINVAKTAIFDHSI